MWYSENICSSDYLPRPNVVRDFSFKYLIRKPQFFLDTNSISDSLLQSHGRVRPNPGALPWSTTYHSDLVPVRHSPAETCKRNTEIGRRNLSASEKYLNALCTFSFNIKEENNRKERLIKLKMNHVKTLAKKYKNAQEIANQTKLGRF